MLMEKTEERTFHLGALLGLVRAVPLGPNRPEGDVLDLASFLSGDRAVHCGTFWMMRAIVCLELLRQHPWLENIPHPPAWVREGEGTTWLWMWLDRLGQTVGHHHRVTRRIIRLPNGETASVVYPGTDVSALLEQFFGEPEGDE